MQVEQKSNTLLNLLHNLDINQTINNVNNYLIEKVTNYFKIKSSAFFRYRYKDNSLKLLIPDKLKKKY